MPTLVDLDSFQHQVLEVANVGAVGPPASWYQTTETAPVHSGTNITFDSGQPRTADHDCSIKVSHRTAGGTQVRMKVPAGGTINVVSFYIRTGATNPTSTVVDMFQFGAPTNAFIGLNSSGQVTARVGAGTIQNGSTDICDGNWHRIDAKYDHSTTSGTLDVQVDGVALTQATGTVTVGNMTDWNLGGTAAQASNFDVWYSDMVVSFTSGDYPIGDHICLAREINGTGTHSPSTGAFTDQAGGTSDAALLAAVDDAWDGTTPDLDQTGEDYVQQTANAAAGYVEFTVEDARAEDTAIWAVELGTLMASEDATTAMNCETRLTHSGTTYATTGLIDPSGSSTIYNGYRVINSSSPGADGWSDTEFNAIRVRFGFSTDAAPDAIFNSAIVEYAAPWSAPAGGETITGTVLTITPSLPTGTVAKTSVLGTVLTITPSLPTGKLDHKLTGVVLTVTPSLPTGQVTVPGPQTVTGVVLTITPSLPTGKLDHRLTGVVLTVTPSLPTGTVTRRLTGVVLTVTPSLPTGTVTRSLTGVVLTVTPSLPTGKLDHRLTGVVLTVTPTLPAGSVSAAGEPQTVTGVVLTIAPSLPAGALQHSLTGIVLTVTPTLPVGDLDHGLTGVVLTIAPSLPIGEVVGPVALTGLVLTIAPTLPVGIVEVADRIVEAAEASYSPFVLRPVRRRYFKNGRR